MLSQVFLTTGHLCIAMEYAERGTLLSYVQARKRLNEQEARHFFQQLIMGLDYCHKMVCTVVNTKVFEISNNIVRSVIVLLGRSVYCLVWYRVVSQRSPINKWRSRAMGLHYKSEQAKQDLVMSRISSIAPNWAYVSPLPPLFLCWTL